MTYDDFKICLRAANLSVRELATLLEMSPNSITNYRARGTVPRHLAVIATLAASLVGNQVDVVELLRQVR